MISKELLSKVLGLTVVKVPELDGIILWYKGIININGSPYAKELSINIYELAHRCKEWARDNEFFLRSFYDYEGAFCYISAPVWVDKIGIPKTGFCSETEPEAIFKACEWILDNKDSK